MQFFEKHRPTPGSMQALLFGLGFEVNGQAVNLEEVTTSTRCGSAGCNHEPALTIRQILEAPENSFGPHCALLNLSSREIYEVYMFFWFLTGASTNPNLHGVHSYVSKNPDSFWNDSWSTLFTTQLCGGDVRKRFEELYDSWFIRDLEENRKKLLESTQLYGIHSADESDTSLSYVKFETNAIFCLPLRAMRLIHEQLSPTLFVLPTKDLASVNSVIKHPKDANNISSIRGAKTAPEPVDNRKLYAGSLISEYQAVNATEDTDAVKEALSVLAETMPLDAAAAAARLV